MNGNLYLIRVLQQKQASEEERIRKFTLAKQLYPVIIKWANKYLSGIIPSGSYAKKTGVKNLTDIDLLISLKNETPFSLKEIYDSLYDYLKKLLLPTRKQNVSIRVNFKGLNIDLVPAKKMPNVIYPHSVWVDKKHTWTKTNIQKHIAVVTNSHRRNEIILTKIWRELNGLDFPSFYLELSVIRALQSKHIGFPHLKDNMVSVFRYLSKELMHASIVDPANSQNIISNDLTDDEKEKIAKTALSGLVEYCLEDSWNNVIW